ncbi:hypothetical protein, partial [Silanimonas lenta]|uniref:hypothetical protein n=1 Tax=Silanimonas lenta TaxID=265429 RepID=UPI002FDF3EF7
LNRGALLSPRSWELFRPSIEGPDAVAPSPDPATLPYDPYFADQLARLVKPAPGSRRYYDCLNLLVQRRDLPRECQAGPLNDYYVEPAKENYDRRSAMGWIHRYMERASPRPREMLQQALAEHLRARRYAWGPEQEREVDEQLISAIRATCAEEGTISVGNGGYWPFDYCMSALSRSLFEVRGTGDWGARAFDAVIAGLPDLVSAGLQATRAGFLSGLLHTEVVRSMTDLPDNSFNRRADYVNRLFACQAYWHLWHDTYRCGEP